MIARMTRLPGVETAAAVSALPFSGTAANVAFSIEGRPAPEPGQTPTANVSFATPGYLEALEIALLRGRRIESGDRPDGTSVAVVSQAMAARFFPGQDAIGQSIRVLGNRPRTIVGIVEDIRTREFQTAPQPEIYIPHTQFPTGGMFLVVRVRSGDPALLAPAVRAELRALDPDLPIASLRTGREVVASTLSARRFSLLLMSLFAATTLALAILGVYSVQSYGVAQRTKELGIRVALGATERDVLRLVLRQGMTPVLVGSLIGLTAALAATTLLSRMLFEIRPFDPPTLAGAVGLLTLAALAASLIPGRRAARVDAIAAMRSGVE
jgi:putative ABC transport system permease protein